MSDNNNIYEVERIVDRKIIRGKVSEADSRKHRHNYFSSGNSTFTHPFRECFWLNGKDTTMKIIRGSH